VGTLIGIVVQLTTVCVATMLGSASGLTPILWIWVLAFMAPSILYDAFAASMLSVPRVVEDLED
jgi:hypothetical protein